MPVQAINRNGKWRVVEADSGKLARNAKGTPVDGGGFGSEEQASKQSRAINASLHKKGKI